MSGTSSLPLARRIAAQIRAAGPITVAEYMTLALHDPVGGYYARHVDIGPEGDFITAPEASQMFGEMVGLWTIHSWNEMGAPSPFHVIELGPGSGALISDFWRATRISQAFRDAAAITLVEASRPLRGRQAARLADRGPDARWADSLATAPRGPAIIIANEFLDCLPIRQFVRTPVDPAAPDGRLCWRERVVGIAADGERLAFGLAADPAPVDHLLPPEASRAPPGAVFEITPGLESLVDEAAARLTAHPGRLLIIDYGDSDHEGDTLQAVRTQQKVDPLESPGGADLTAHVNFGAVARLAKERGLDVAGPASQGGWLCAIGLGARLETLIAARPDRAEGLRAQFERLVAPEQMGTLFKAICLSSPGLPAPAGFPR